MLKNLKLVVVFLSLAVSALIVPQAARADCVTNDDCKPGQQCTIVDECVGGTFPDCPGGYTEGKECEGTPYSDQNTCFGCNATGAFCSTYETTAGAGCGPGYDYNNSNCDACGGGGGGCTEINYSPTPPFDVYTTANGAQVKITHLSHSTGNDNYGRPFVAPFPMYYDWNNIYHPPGEPQVTDYSAAYTQCQAGTNIDSQNNWGSSSGNTVTIQTTITRHTENWGSSNTSQYQDQSGWQLDIQNSGYHFNSCTGPTSIGPIWDATSDFETVPQYGTITSYQVYGPDDCNPQTNLYIAPASGTSASDQNGTVSPPGGATATTSTPVKVVATGTTLCSTGITNPPTSAGGLTGCVAVSPFSCSSGNPDDTLSCWGQWSCTSSSTTGTYPVSFTSSANSACLSSVNMNVTLPIPTATATYPGFCTSQGQAPITVSWNKISGAVTYEANRYTSSDAGATYTMSGSFVPPYTCTSTTCSFVDTVTPGYWYAYTISADAGSGPGLPSPRTAWVNPKYPDPGCDTTDPTISLNMTGSCVTQTGWPNALSGSAGDLGGVGLQYLTLSLENPDGSSAGQPDARYPASGSFPLNTFGFPITPPNPFSWPGAGKSLKIVGTAFDNGNHSASTSVSFITSSAIGATCPQPFFQTQNGDVHSNGTINVNGTAPAP